MPPAKPAKKRARKTAQEPGPRPKPKGHCRTCGERIRVPKGWTLGPAVRRHYWAKHRDVMLPPSNKAKR